LREDCREGHRAGGVDWQIDGWSGASTERGVRRYEREEGYIRLKFEYPISFKVTCKPYKAGDAGTLYR